MPRGLRNSENVDVIESTLEVLYNITKNLENIRKHPKKGRETPTSGFTTSLLVTLIGHVTSGSHVGTFCTTAIVRRKKRGGKSGHAQKNFP
jgi:hypothetical protein